MGQIGGNPQHIPVVLLQPPRIGFQILAIALCAFESSRANIAILKPELIINQSICLFLLNGDICCLFKDKLTYGEGKGSVRIVCVPYLTASAPAGSDRRIGCARMAY